MEAYKQGNKIHIFLNTGELIEDKELASANFVYDDQPFLNTDEETEDGTWRPYPKKSSRLETLHKSTVWPIHSYSAKKENKNGKVNVTFYDIDDKDF